MPPSKKSNSLNITMFPASYGDSFFVSVGEDDLDILIDSGFSFTYEDHIKPKLTELNTKNKSLDFLIITHIDADHISGALSLLEANNLSKIIDIKNIWHNSYRHIQNKPTNKKEISLKDQRILQQIMANGYKKNRTVVQNHKKNLSVKQGSSLASLIYKGGYNWNKQFNNEAICVENDTNIKLSNNVNLILLSPEKSKLQKLMKFWEKEFRKLGISRAVLDNHFLDDAFEFLVSREKPINKNIKKNISSKEVNIEKLMAEDFEEDNTPTNGSSISFVLEYGSKKILFLGDSHPSIIERALRKQYQQEQLWFDAIKVSHHGSHKNTSPSLLSFIDSDIYFISTNGAKFGHPDLTTIARIIGRKTSISRKMIFNYETKISKYFDNEELKKTYNYSIVISAADETFTFVKD
ncbi:AVAST type 1 anti-phage system MBL fold metallo-hydrolase Avs1a [Pseudoalteromonas sp. NGC95]|uniref:AVAST type 1 anti-phage system MBL fold metallo-hydrolase Avs1a n=1 Tax=Pseudoalteromonas sp. NGC95 TaxID=2792051 RepID=UPI0018CD9970|nr:AVAST type 1 anti-phage system MBL fold metallo-hydrolase Avs1a [Pseudoalteromonas sp. NGC95]MBH0018648.1 MBL fold metallo-hydrolase [Pseudoalteromonas sp. NGC95]